MEAQISKIKAVLTNVVSGFKTESETAEIVDKAIAHIIAQHNVDKAIEIINDNMNIVASRLIDRCITWSNTEEGRTYWNDLHNVMETLEERRLEARMTEIRQVAIFHPEVVYSEEGKTIPEWIETLPQPQRSQFYYEFTKQLNDRLKNCNSEFEKDIELQMYNKHAYNYITRLKHALSIGATYQGASYWNKFFNFYERVRYCIDEIEETKRQEAEAKRREEERRIIEANRLTFSTSFREMLYSIRNASLVADTLLTERYQTRAFGNYITMRGEMATYLPEGRELKLTESGKWARDGRQETRVGKLARKLLNEQALQSLTDTDFEKFANAVKSYISVIGDEDGDGKKMTFKVVSGEDIRHSYLWENYSAILGKETNLWGSCMRHESCQEYLDMYVMNPQVCSLLVAHDTDGKVLGRALLWESTQGRKLMDTIYSHESLFPAFKGWAMDNGYFYKSSQSCHHESFDMFDGAEHRLSNHDIVVKLIKGIYNYYPYLDTLKYLSDSGHLTNNDGMKYKKLESTDGDCSEREGIVWSEYQEEDIDEDEAVFLDYTRPNGRRIASYVNTDIAVTDVSGDWYLEEDCVEVGNDWYLSNDEAIVEDINGDYQLAEECVFSEAEDGYIHSDDAQLINGGDDYCLTEHAVKCAYNNEMYHEDDMIEIDGVCIHKDVKEEYLLTLNETE